MQLDPIDVIASKAFEKRIPIPAPGPMAPIPIASAAPIIFAASMSILLCLLIT